MSEPLPSSDVAVAPSEVAPKKNPPVGISYYGESFVGFMKIGELADLIPAFKEKFYMMRVDNPATSTAEVVRQFNHAIQPRKFHPYPNQLRNWVKKWEADILAQMRMQEADKKEIIPMREVHQVIKTRGERALDYEAPSDEDMEMGVRTLGGELINDALSELRQVQLNPEQYDEEDLMRRRAYVVNVFAQTTRMSHGKAALLLKASKEKRENAGFLMDLLARATSGKMRPEDLEMLKTATPQVVVHEQHEPSIAG